MQNPQKTYKKTSQQQLDTALHLINVTKLSISKAAIRSNIKVSTLRKIIKRNNNDLENTTQLRVENVGTRRALPFEDEVTLASVSRLRAKWGFGLTAVDIKDLVKQFVDCNKNKDSPLGLHLRKYCHFKVSKFIVRSVASY